METKNLKFLLIFLPSLAFAWAPNTAFKDVIQEIINVLVILYPILFSLAVLIFFWGVSKFILNSGSQVENEKGRKYMLWGVLVLFILFSFRVIISLISSDLGLGDSKGIPFLVSDGVTPVIDSSIRYNLQ